MKCYRIFLVILMAVGLALGAGCSKSEKAGDKTSASKSPKVGDSCKGLSSTDGVMACEGNTKIFCSSVSEYKWKSLGDCGEGTKCVLGAGGKSVECK